MQKPDQHIIMERIEQLRIERGYSKSKVYKSIGVRASSYTLWENGGQIKTSNIIALSNFFQVSSDYLLGLSNNCFETNTPYSLNKQKLIQFIQNNNFSEKQCHLLLKLIQIATELNEN